MSKRIYVGKDVEDTARKTGIPVATLRKAAVGEVVLTAAQLEKLKKTLGEGGRPRPDRGGS